MTVLPFRKPDPHILIVEDDDTTLEVFVEFVQMKITKRVRGVRNAWSAIEYLNACRPIDLVLTDISLYFGRTDVVGMNGIELTGIIKRNWDIPVIVMTGYKPELQKPAALAAGASFFLAKPFKFEVLEAAFNQLLSEAPASRRSRFSRRKTILPHKLSRKGIPAT